MRTCPLCQSEHHDTLYTMPTGQLINCCSDCGMIYSDGLPPMDYVNNSIYTCAETYQSQKAHYERIVSTVRENVRSQSYILDIGCATGGLVKAFIAEGFQYVTGISISAAEVDVCRKQGLTAYTAEEYAKSVGWDADLITVSHVLEHVPDVLTFLRDLQRWIKPDGEVYIEVPDATGYSECFTSICQGFNSEHINHFSGSYLAEALRRSGFNVVQSGAYRMSIERTDAVYPCVWVIAKPCSLDTSLKSSIEGYIEKIESQIEQVRAHLRKELNGTSDLAVWGMSETTRLLLSDGVITRAMVKVATDTNPVYHGQFINSIWVVSPQEFKPDANIPILICSQTHKDEILTRIKELGITNRVITLDSL